MIQLYDYQNEGVEFLVNNKHALLADEMGLGKSAQAIRAAGIVYAREILIICPSNARINWQREFKKFSNYNDHFIILATKKDKFKPNQSYILSYEMAVAFYKQLTYDHHWGVCIIDESHFLKSIDARRTKAVYGKKGFIRNCTGVWHLSGTPAPNHAGELWPMLYTFGKTKLSYIDFVKQFCTTYPSPYGYHQIKITGTKIEKIPELKALLEGFMLRRVKENVLKQMPKITYKQMTVETSPIDFEMNEHLLKWIFPNNRQDAYYKEVEEQSKAVESLIDQMGLQSQGTAGGLEALCRSVSTLRMHLATQKVKAIGEMLFNELENGEYHKLVIFAVHKVLIEGLFLKLKKFKPVTLYGGTPPEKRQRNIDKFQKTPHHRVFIGNIQAAGVAINLTAAHNVVFAEQDWVPGNNAQAVMRCHRIGQTKPVLVRVLMAENTIDEKVSQILKIKTRQLTRLFDSD